MPVRDIDHGWKELDRRVRAFGRGHVLVGVLGPKADAPHRGSGLTVADVASFNEFGLGVPERSFIRATMDENEGKLMRLTAETGRGVVLGTLAPEQSLGLVGEFAVGLIQERISDGIPPANRPSTIAKKGSSTPLIDEGQLRQSISHKVEV